MKDWNDRLDEYIDGLLPPDEAREIEEALAKDPLLREELERVRRFAGFLEEQTPDAHVVVSVLGRLRARRRRRLLLIAVPIAAALALLLLWPPKPPPNPSQAVLAEVEAQWLAFGSRLGDIAAER